MEGDPAEIQIEISDRGSCKFLMESRAESPPREGVDAMEGGAPKKSKELKDKKVHGPKRGKSARRRGSASVPILNVLPSGLLFPHLLCYDQTSVCLLGQCVLGACASFLPGFRITTYGRPLMHLYTSGRLPRGEK
jgi:hypothetical protein